MRSYYYNLNREKGALEKKLTIEFPSFTVDSKVSFNETHKDRIDVLREGETRLVNHVFREIIKGYVDWDGISNNDRELILGWFSNALRRRGLEMKSVLSQEVKSLFNENS